MLQSLNAFRCRKTNLCPLISAVIACSFVTPTAWADGGDFEVRSPGKQLFEQEWEYEQPSRLPDFSKVRLDVRAMASFPGDGLGPMHNATSCEACHAQGGAAGVERNVTLLTLDPRNKYIRSDTDQLRRSLVELYPGIITPLGAVTLDVVVHEKSSRPFYDHIRSSIASHIPDGAPDEWFVSTKRTAEAIADRPVLAGRYRDLDFYLSQRNSPPLFGLGLIDRINRAQLVRIARSQASRTDGRVTGRLGVGKFGWRAQTTNLSTFIRGACAGELGLQVMGTPQPPDLADETYVNPGFDLTENQVVQLISYVSDLPRPIQETRMAKDSVHARTGKRLFNKIGCNVCHVEYVEPARGIYSDLLLHDMGDLLQAPSPAPAGSTLTSMPRLPLPRLPSSQNPPFRFAPFGPSIGGYYGSPSSTLPRAYPMARPNRPKFPWGKLPAEAQDVIDPKTVTWDAMQREWRTPPLWGVADSGPYLHDGRAETLDAAIRWHGGEASNSATAYRGLPPEDREKVIAFLASLRAPVSGLRQKVDRNVGPRFVSHRANVADESKVDDELSVFDPAN